MWLTLIVMVVSYLVQPRGTSAERKRALLSSAALGAVTYGVTEYTSWGQENLAPLNEALTPSFLSSKPETVANPTAPVLTAPGMGGAQQTGSSGLWDTLKSWGPAGVAGVAGAVGIASGALSSSTIWLIGGGILALVLLSN